MLFFELFQVLSAIAFACAVSQLGLRLASDPPNVRVARGVTGIIVAPILFLGLMKLLPRSSETGMSTLTDALVWVALAPVACILVLSIMEIMGGAAQALKRWLKERQTLR